MKEVEMLSPTDLCPRDMSSEIILKFLLSTTVNWAQKNSENISNNPF